MRECGVMKFMEEKREREGSKKRKKNWKKYLAQEEGKKERNKLFLRNIYIYNHIIKNISFCL